MLVCLFTSNQNQKIKYEEPHSPYNDKYDDDENGMNYSGNEARLANYSPHGNNSQKPEWKRYKQYTRSDIAAAIECVKNGMSALQASRLYKVPSRTLYDKVKKLGITAGRPMNRQSIKRSPSNNGSPAVFPYGISGTRSPYPHGMDNNQSHSQVHNDMENGNDSMSRKLHLPSVMPHPAASLLDPAFLQQALNRGGGNIDGHEAIHAMAMVAAAQAAAASKLSTSPSTHGTARSPSPSVMVKFMQSHSPNGDMDEHHHEQSTPTAHAQLLTAAANRSPSRINVRSMDENDDDEEQDDHVEDLSISKKEHVAMPRSPSPRSRSTSPSDHPIQPSQLGVIVPPIAKMLHNNKDENNISVTIKHEIAIDDN